jgi:hypothetical protein
VSTADYANRAPIAIDSLNILRQVSDKAAATPRKCVGCTDIGADTCPECYAKLYPRDPLPAEEVHDTGDPQ